MTESRTTHDTLILLHRKLLELKKRNCKRIPPEQILALEEFCLSVIKDWKDISFRKRLYQTHYDHLPVIHRLAEICNGGDDRLHQA